MSVTERRDIESFRASRRGRNRALLIVLLALCALFYVLSIVRMSGG